VAGCLLPLFCRRTAARAGRREFPGVLRPPCEIALEKRLLTRAILQAREVGPQLAGRFPRQRVNHPVALAPRRHQPAPAQVIQVLGDFHLRLAQHDLEMAHAQRPAQQQVEDAQPRAVAQAFVDSHQFHAETIFLYGNILQAQNRRAIQS